MDVVWSKSASQSGVRPFYAALAQAYDQLIDSPAKPWVDAVCAELARAGFRVDAEVLDSGCGTGRHAAGIIRRGHRVDLADASRDLLHQAAARCPGSRVYCVDLCQLTLPRQYDAVTSRGVLNDMIEDDERDAVLQGFARVLRPGGVLVLDVRDTDASATRADGATRSRTVTIETGSRLTFKNTVTWQDGLLRVREQYELRGDRTQDWQYDFTMRPWTRRELTSRLSAAQFTLAEVRQGVGRATSDRLFVVAHRN